jgi:hypothetical protein
MVAAMTMYVVFQEGVYRHACGGVFSSLELAQRSADALKAHEPDNYHQWTVVPFELDVIVEKEAETAYTAPGDPSKVESCGFRPGRIDGKEP